jgi:hypothetical protein
MEILWLAIVFYSLGLAAVLYWRPRTMFHGNGTWKEFGYQRDSRHTIFPFWLFAIAWAFVSYAGAAAVTWVVTSGPVAAGAVATAASTALHFTEDDANSLPDFGSVVSMNSAPDMTEATPVSRVTSKVTSTKKEKEKLRPGYYVLDESSPETGLKRYIYYGTNRP